MLSTRTKLNNNIIYHINGEGAFYKLSKNCSIDKKQWNELLKSLNMLQKLWDGETEVEKVVALALFDFERLLRIKLNECSGIAQEDSEQLLAKFKIFNIFYNPLIKTEKFDKEHMQSNIFENELSEAEMIKYIYYHVYGYGAFHQARTYRIFNGLMWEELIAAIKKLQQIWKDKNIINRNVVAALINLPMYIEWQADFFKEENNQMSEIEKFEAVSKKISVEIKKLLA